MQIQSQTSSWLIYRLVAEYNTTWSRISHPFAVVVGQLELRRDIYPCNVTLVRRYTLKEHGKASLQRCSYRRNEHNGLCFFPYQLLKNESSRLSIRKIALKVQLNVIQLTRSQSISQLSTKCTEVCKIKKLSFLSIF